MHQSATYSHPVDAASLPAGFEHVRLWRATIDSPGSRNYAEFFAFFNIGEEPAKIRATWKQLGLEGSKHTAQDVWSDAAAKDSKGVDITLSAHSSVVYEVK